MSKRSKSLRAADAKIDRDKLYAPLEAVRLAKETSTSKFDGTVGTPVATGCFLVAATTHCAITYRETTITV